MPNLAGKVVEIYELPKNSFDRKVTIVRVESFAAQEIGGEKHRSPVSFVALGSGYGSNRRKTGKTETCLEAETEELNDLDLRDPADEKNPKTRD